MTTPAGTPRIVVLDSYTLNPGDLSWERLESLGSCEFFDRTPPNEVVDRSKDADIVITNKALVTREAINQMPGLKYIGVTATGYNIVDVEAARERDIPVTNVPSYGTGSVAQMAFAHLLNLTQRVADHGQSVRAGRWARSPDWCFWDFPLIELEGTTLGIIGLGRIGRATARLGRAFGMEVIACNRSPVENSELARMVDLETVFRESDVVSLHCPLTADNEKLVSAERLRLMKPTAFLINTSRGPLVDEQALADALNNDRLAGAGVDVVWTEPPSGDNPLFTAKNCYVTPHIAWATRASRARLMEIAVENVAAFLRGEPQNVVTR